MTTPMPPDQLAPNQRHNLSSCYTSKENSDRTSNGARVNYLSEPQQTTYSKIAIAEPPLTMSLSPKHNQLVIDINPSSPADEPPPMLRQAAPSPNPLSRDTATEIPSPTPTSLLPCLLPPSPRFHLTLAQRNDWAAARILNENSIPACLAGSPVSALYGSDDLWICVPILVEDAFLETACRVLIENGFKDISTDEGHILEDFQPPEENQDGTKAVGWRLLSIILPQNSFRKRKGLRRVILIPSSHWHFDIQEGTTIDVEGIRVPKLVSYLQALVSILAYRSKSSIPAGYYIMQLLSIWILRSNYPTELEDLPATDKFFIENYSSLKKLHNREKLVEVWEKLKTGEIGMEQAVEQVPVERKFPNLRRPITEPIATIYLYSTEN